MQRFGHMGRQLMVRPATSSSVQPRCPACQLRRFSCSPSRHSEEEAPRPSTSRSPESSASAFDTLLSRPDAFERNDEPTASTRKSQAPRGQGQNLRIPRSVLKRFDDGYTDLAQDFSSQLNKDWDGKHGSEGRQEKSASGRPYISRRRQDYMGTMTPKEKELFSKVFNSLAEFDKDKKSLPVDDGQFASSLLSDKTDSLLDFRLRNVKDWDPRRTRKPLKPRRFPALLTEGVTAESVSSQELEEKIDLAREEVTACQTVADVWMWASKHVWRERGEEAEAESPTRVNDQTEGGQGKERGEDVRFGMSTPFYAPVLHLLLVTLRERFKSPQSALSVLRVARNLGPDSFVLGCTPQLYAEALRTRWTVLQDLQGAMDTLQEAKDTGILGSGFSRPAAAFTARFAGEQGAPDNEADTIRDIVANQIKTEVRQHVVDGSARLGGDQSSLAYAHQLQLVRQMDRLAMARPKRQPSAP